MRTMGTPPDEGVEARRKSSLLEDCRTAFCLPNISATSWKSASVTFATRRGTFRVSKSLGSLAPDTSSDDADRVEALASQGRLKCGGYWTARSYASAVARNSTYPRAKRRR